jgi:hypothetical protein
LERREGNSREGPAITKPRGIWEGPGKGKNETASITNKRPTIRGEEGRISRRGIAEQFEKGKIE